MKPPIFDYYAPDTLDEALALLQKKKNRRLAGIVKLRVRTDKSGEVTEVDPPHEVRFTWGWHDAEDNRGAESQVSIRIIDLGDRQARLVLRHVGLADAEVRQGHNRGWSAFLQKFAAGVAEAAP